MEFPIMVDIFFLIFLLELEIYSQGRFQKLILLTSWIFFAIIVKYILEQIA